MDLTKKKHFDIISSTFPFKVQMTYGDNDIPVHYVYSNSGRECAMIFFWQNWLLTRHKTLRATHSNRCQCQFEIHFQVVPSTKVHLHFFR